MQKISWHCPLKQEANVGAGGVRRKVYKKEKKGKGETVLARSQESDYYGDEDYTSYYIL